VLVRYKVLQDRLQSSLFFVPMLFVLGGAALGELMLVIDDRVEGVPTRLTATVDSARNVLSVVAGATLAFAGIAFSVSLLLISLASSQYSPRVVHGLFRDPFNKRVMGVVIGTFTYCLVVMQAVRGPLEETGESVVPSVSIVLAVLLGVASILSIVAFISHGAHLMDVSKILHGVTEEAIERIRDGWPEAGDDDDSADEVSVPEGEGHPVVFDRHGWVQQIDYGALFDLLPPGACLRLDTAPGRYAIPDTPLATIWPTPEEPQSVDRRARDAVIIGETRTMQEDVAYGVRQLADVALKALSPGINDPTTAQDALFHLGSVLRELLVRRCPDRQTRGHDGRTILRPHEITHEELIAEAFDEVRLASAQQPTVQISLLEILHLLSLSLDAAPGTDVRATALLRQAGLVLEVSERADLPGADHDRVRAAYEKRFAS
jgi:uncharacterized membrane protein